MMASIFRRQAAIRKCLHTLCLLPASGCATIVSKSYCDVAVECASPNASVNICVGDELI